MKPQWFYFTQLKKKIQLFLFPLSSSSCPTPTSINIGSHLPVTPGIQQQLICLSVDIYSLHYQISIQIGLSSSFHYHIRTWIRLAYSLHFQIRIQIRLFLSQRTKRCQMSLQTLFYLFLYYFLILGSHISERMERVRECHVRLRRLKRPDFNKKGCNNFLNV